jgi:hypothetical protein
MSDDFRTLINLGKKLSRCVAADLTYVTTLYPQYQHLLDLIKSIFIHDHPNLQRLIAEIAQYLRTEYAEIWDSLRKRESAYDFVKQKLGAHGEALDWFYYDLTPAVRNDLWKRFNRYMAMIENIPVSEKKLNPREFYPKIMGTITSVIDPQTLVKITEIVIKEKTNLMSSFPPELQEIAKFTMDSKMASSITPEHIKSLLGFVTNSISATRPQQDSGPLTPNQIQDLITTAMEQIRSKEKETKKLV